MDCVDAGNVLVHLFLQTKTHYVLTNKKLQYLLIIAQMSRLSQGRTLFEDDIRNFKQSFVLDTIGNNFLAGTEIVSGKAIDKPINYDISTLVLPYSKKKIYEISQMPPKEDKDLLVGVFLAFGAYQEKTLCRLLCEFKALRNVPAFSVVSKDKIQGFFTDVFSKNKLVNNPVFVFIKERRLESTLVTERPESSVPKPIPADTVTPAPTEKADVASEDASVTCPTRPQAVLKGLSSLQNIVAGKQYSVFVELPAPKLDCQVSVVSVASNESLSVIRKRLSDTVYRFTFIGIASDIKISAHVIS